MRKRWRASRRPAPDWMAWHNHRDRCMKLLIHARKLVCEQIRKGRDEECNRKLPCDVYDAIRRCCDSAGDPDPSKRCVPSYVYCVGKDEKHTMGDAPICKDCYADPTACAETDSNKHPPVTAICCRNGCEGYGSVTCTNADTIAHECLHACDPPLGKELDYNFEGRDLAAYLWMWVNCWCKE